MTKPRRKKETIEANDRVTLELDGEASDVRLMAHALRIASHEYRLSHPRVSQRLDELAETLIEVLDSLSPHLAGVLRERPDLEVTDVANEYLN